MQVALQGASATDNSGVTPTITYSPASNTDFAVGTTTVSVTATDASGNGVQCTYSVTVVRGELNN